LPALPDFEFKLALAGILEGSGRWIRFVSAFAEVIGVDPNRRAIRLLVRHFWDSRLAEQFGGHQLAAACGGPAPLERELEIKAIGLLDHFERRVPFRFDQ